MSKEAMKLALEALEAELDPSWNCNSYHPKIHTAMTALREALAEQPAPLTDTELINRGCHYQTELTQQAQQEQGWETVPVEPTVAMIDATGAVEADMREMVVANWKEMLAAAPQPAQQEHVAFSQFLSDVVTAAGLLSHGKTDKSLAARISEFAFRLRTSQQPAPATELREQEPEYTWPTVAEYECDVGFKTNDAFRMGWDMARTTNKMLGITSPPQRAWVGLTEEETGHWAADFLDGAKWAEAKLREKNGITKEQT